jgi:hypothetical protein
LKTPPREIAPPYVGIASFEFLDIVRALFEDDSTLGVVDDFLGDCLEAGDHESDNLRQPRAKK